jgi:hypothetical protein
VTRFRSSKFEIRTLPTAIFVLTLALCIVGLPLMAEAQQRAQTARIGWVAVGPPSARASMFLEAFRQGLRDLGYVEGQNFAIEARWADASLDRVADFTADLVRLKMDVIVTQGPVVSVVKKAAGTIPIVFGFSGDPSSSRNSPRVFRASPSSRTLNTLVSSGSGRRRRPPLEALASRYSTCRCGPPRISTTPSGRSSSSAPGRSMRFPMRL